MRRYLVPVLLALSISIVACAEQPKEGPGRAAVGAISVEATIEAINYETREVTLKSADGSKRTLKIGEEARNFNQAKKGDIVKIDYLEAVAVDVRKTGADVGAEAEVAIERAPLGAKPGGIISKTLEVTAQVQAIDYDTRHVTLIGPAGNEITLRVGEEATRFNEVQKGDKVVVQYVEAIGISVTTPKG